MAGTALFLRLSGSVTETPAATKSCDYEHCLAILGAPGTRKYCVCLASALRLTSLWVRVAEPRDGVSILCLFHPDWLDLGAIRGDPSFLGGCLIPGGRDEPRGPLLSAPPRALGLDSLLAAIRTGSTKYLTNSPSLICRVSG